MTLVMKSVLITAGLGLLFIIFEWNLMRKKKEGVTPTDKKNLRFLVLFTAGACGVGAFGWANVF